MARFMIREKLPGVSRLQPELCECSKGAEFNVENLGLHLNHVYQFHVTASYESPAYTGVISQK